MLPALPRCAEGRFLVGWGGQVGCRTSKPRADWGSAYDVGMLSRCGVGKEGLEHVPLCADCCSNRDGVRAGR